jgi:hypothetical protein
MIFEPGASMQHLLTLSLISRYTWTGAFRIKSDREQVSNSTNVTINVDYVSQLIWTQRENF